MQPRFRVHCYSDQANRVSLGVQLVFSIWRLVLSLSRPCHSLTVPVNLSCQPLCTRFLFPSFSLFFLSDSQSEESIVSSIRDHLESRIDKSFERSGCDRKQLVLFLTVQCYQPSREPSDSLFGLSFSSIPDKTELPTVFLLSLLPSYCQFGSLFQPVSFDTSFDPCLSVIFLPLLSALYLLLYLFTDPKIFSEPPSRITRPGVFVLTLFP